MNEEVKRRPTFYMQKECRRLKYKQQTDLNEASDVAKLKKTVAEKCFSKLVWKVDHEGFPHEKAVTVHGIYQVYSEGIWKFFSYNNKQSIEKECRSLDMGKKACQKHHEKLESKVV